jgi:predicted ATPase/class 3 adenylate cyclase/DNA-binding CsgD family transcriptional regulator
MFCDTQRRMLASMSATDWSELGVSELPTGTVTLLLADVEGSTRLWQTQPSEMAAAVAQLDRTLADVISGYDGVRPVEQGEGDSFVIAFARASDAVACALDLQRAPLAPIRLRIGVHTGEVRLRDEGNYIGPTINRTARLRDLAHGGQTVLSGATEPLVVDQLPVNAWLSDLGTHPLRDLPRPERVVQLCHPDLRNDFPPLRTADSVVNHNLPPQRTSFVGRQAEMNRLREDLAGNQVVTLTGPGGVGKTRLAVHLAAALADQFGDGVRYVDLAPITDPDVVPVAVARALGLPDQPGRSTMDTLLRFVRDRRMLIVLDNCEHLLDASADLVVALLGAAPGLTLLATSREPIGVTGEATRRVPSLSVADEAVELFADRAHLALSEFALTNENADTVSEICRRLDGLPLAIELAAARVRALSLTEILDGLRDRFRLLTGGSRIAVRRQQTLHASVDWSHALLTETERVMFRRLAVFLGGFDLDAAQAVGGDGDMQRFQVLDLLTLLVDKSLVVAENSSGRTRYRLLETVRQYALEKLGESGEADAARSRHRDHYAAMAALLDAPGGSNYEHHIEQIETELDNLRAAFTWSCENSDIEQALMLASSLQPLWLTRGRIKEGRDWFNSIFTGEDAQHFDVKTVVGARALADKAELDLWQGNLEGMAEAQRALAIARDIADSAVLARALTACGIAASYSAELAQPYFAEAVGLARELDARWRLSQILGLQANMAIVDGDPIAARAIAQEGLEIADAIGDRPDARQCRWCLATAKQFQGDLSGAVADFDVVTAEAEAAHDLFRKPLSLGQKAYALAYQGDIQAARAAADAAHEADAELGGTFVGFVHLASALTELAAGDVRAAAEATEAARQHLSVAPGLAAVQSAFNAQAALAAGDLAEARRRADDAVAATSAWYRMVALTTRARVAIAQGDLQQAEFDAYDALAQCALLKAHLGLPDIFECLGTVVGEGGRHREASRIFGAAEAIRRRLSAPRFKIYDAGYSASIGVLRDAINQADFDAAWAEGAALSTEEAIAYAQRGHGERKRPSSGWASLTPAERDVVRLVKEGLPNKDIAERLFVSPRTVQAHLTHVYTKLGLTSRVQLAEEAGQH